MIRLTLILLLGVFSITSYACDTPSPAEVCKDNASYFYNVALLSDEGRSLKEATEKFPPTTEHRKFLIKFTYSPVGKAVTAEYHVYAYLELCRMFEGDQINIELYMQQVLRNFQQPTGGKVI